MGLTTEGKFEHKFNPVVVGLDVSALAQRAAYSNYLVGVGSSSAPNLLQLSQLPTTGSGRSCLKGSFATLTTRHGIPYTTLYVEPRGKLDPIWRLLEKSVHLS